MARRPRIAREALAICTRADELLVLLGRFARRHGPTAGPCDVEARILLDEAAGAAWALGHLVVAVESCLSAFTPGDPG